MLRVIRDVLYYPPGRTGTRLESALQFLNHVQPRRSVSFIISDFIDQDYERAFRVTAKRHDLISIIVGDKRETTWLAVGLVDWIDAESGQRIVVDTSDLRTRRALAEHRHAEKTALQDLLRTSRADAIEVFAGEAYEREFMRFFRLRERRLRG